jgi:hypothetical protein
VFGVAVPLIVPLLTIAPPAVTSPVTRPPLSRLTPPPAERTSPRTVLPPSPIPPLLNRLAASPLFAGP